MQTRGRKEEDSGVSVTSSSLSSSSDSSEFSSSSSSSGSSVGSKAEVFQPGSLLTTSPAKNSSLDPRWTQPPRCRFSLTLRLHRL